jgi:4-hydroxybenzoate polyprenyltransferase
MELVIKFFNLIRWKNLIILLLTQLFTFFFLSQFECFNFEITRNLLIINFSTISIAAAGYLINDYFDLKIDAVNKPDQIIIEKYISRRWVLFFHSSFNIVGIIAGIFVSKYFAVISIMISILLWLYSAYFKKTFIAGNFLIAFLMALTLPVVVFAGVPLLKDWLFFYTFFAFLTGISREIIKDIEDTEGDSRYDSRSIPVLLGFYQTKYILKIITILTILTLISGVGYLLFRNYYTLSFFLLIFVFSPLIYFLIKLSSLHSYKQFGHVSRLFKMIMVAGIFSMAIRCLTF